MSELTPMDAWNFIAPLLLNYVEQDDYVIKIYVMIYHALKLEEEYRKKNEKA